MKRVSQLIHRFGDTMEDNHLSAYQRHSILDMAKFVSDALTERYRRVKEGVEKIMGGKVIETEASRIYKQGGKDRLIEDAKAMLDDGLEPERVARILHISVEKLEELVGLVTT